MRWAAPQDRLALADSSDAPYRYHGSSVNGPGRGLVVLVEAGPWWDHPSP